MGPEYRAMGAELWRDPFPLYRRLRDEDPVHRSPEGYWVLTRFGDVFAAARDTETFSSAQGLTFLNESELLGLAPTVVIMDPPDHTRYRRLVNRAFTPRAVSALEADLRAFVRTVIDGARQQEEVDFVDALAKPVPAWLVARYLGVPDEDRGRFAAWTDAIVQAATGVYGGIGEALTELYGYFAELVELKRRRPGADLVSDLLAADEEGRGIGVEGALGYAFVLIAGGNDTTAGLLAGAAELLTARPDQRRRLIEDPGLVDGAVEELLRLTSPVQGLCRVATRDVAVGRGDDGAGRAGGAGGRSISAGDRVLLCYGSANRDEREFGADAGELDVGRKIDRILSFSSGAHHCLGAATARLMGRVFLEELLAAMPEFIVDADAGVWAGGAFTRRYEHLPFRRDGLDGLAA